jgi:membrane protease YdiL (CAAX protease family)
MLVRSVVGYLMWATNKNRLWLQAPRSPKTGEVNKKLWWWVIPFLIAFGLLSQVVLVPLHDLFTRLVPALAEPAQYSTDILFENPAALIGRWDIFVLFFVLLVFNTVLGEELVFRGLLLPKMEGVFGKWDWVATMAFPSKRFHSAWFGIIVHSGQTVFLLFLILGVVLGLA